MSAAGKTHRELAELFLGNDDWAGDPQRAAVHAQLAFAESVDRLTAAIEAAQFPELTVKKCLTGFSIRPVTR